MGTVGSKFHSIKQKMKAKKVRNELVNATNAQEPFVVISKSNPPYQGSTYIFNVSDTDAKTIYNRHTYPFLDNSSRPLPKAPFEKKKTEMDISVPMENEKSEKCGFQIVEVDVEINDKTSKLELQNADLYTYIDKNDACVNFSDNKAEQEIYDLKSDDPHANQMNCLISEESNKENNNEDISNQSEEDDNSYLKAEFQGYHRDLLLKPQLKMDQFPSRAPGSRLESAVINASLNLVADDSSISSTGKIKTKMKCDGFINYLWKITERNKNSLLEVALVIGEHLPGMNKCESLQSQGNYNKYNVTNRIQLMMVKAANEVENNCLKIQITDAKYRVDGCDNTVPPITVDQPLNEFVNETPLHIPLHMMLEVPSYKLADTLFTCQVSLSHRNYNKSTTNLCFYLKEEERSNHNVKKMEGNAVYNGKPIKSNHASDCIGDGVNDAMKMEPKYISNEMHSLVTSYYEEGNEQCGGMNDSQI